MFNREVSKNYEDKEKTKSNIYRSKDDGKRFVVSSLVTWKKLELQPQEYYQNELSILNTHLCSIDYNELFISNYLKLKSYVFTVFLISKHLRLRNMHITLEAIYENQVAFIKNRLQKDQIEIALLDLCQNKFLTTKETDPKNIPSATFLLYGSKNCSDYNFEKHNIKTAFYNSKIQITNYSSEYFKKMSSETNFIDLCNSHLICHIFLNKPTTYKEIEKKTGLNRYHFKKIKSLSKQVISVEASLKETDSDLLSGTDNIIAHKEVKGNIQTSTIYQKDYSPFIAKINKHTNDRHPFIGNVFKDEKKPTWNSLIECHKKIKHVKEKALSENNEEIIILVSKIISRKRKGSNYSYLSDSAKVNYTKRWEKNVVTNTDFHQKIYKNLIR